MLRGLKAVVAAAAISLLWTTSTGAAWPIDPGRAYCGTDQTVADVTVLGLGLGGIPAPAPIDGVVTGWAIHIGPYEGGLEQRLQVFRRVDGPVNRFLAVAESSPRMAPSNSREPFKTRIPVENGDLFALRGTVETFLCREMSAVTSALHEGPTPIGSTYEFRAETGLGVPLEVFVEPDEDGDGYGDLTQDRCPRVSTTQNGCPAVKLRVAEALAGARSILLRVAVATKAEVRVYADATYPQRLPGFDGESMVTELFGGGVKTVRPGKVASIGIKLSRRLQRHLKEREQSLKVNLKVLATSVAGRTVERELTVRLPGQRSS